MGGWDAPWHWVVIAIVVIALFGYKKLPDAARSVGRSLRIFKTEVKGMTEDDKARAKAREDAAAAEPRALPPAEVVKNPSATDATAPAAPAASAASATAAPDEAPRSRPRPSPSPNGRASAGANSD